MRRIGPHHATAENDGEGGDAEASDDVAIMEKQNREAGLARSGADAGFGTGRYLARMKDRDSPVVSFLYNFIYCGIPKNGCSRWRRLIRRASGLPWLGQLPRTIHLPPKYANYSALSHLAKHDPVGAAHILDERSKFSFVIVRSPYTRLLSAWLDKRDALQHFMHKYQEE